MPTTSHKNLDDTTETIPFWAMETAREVLLRESHRLSDQGEPDLPHPELRASLTEAIAQALVKARQWGGVIEGTENERARDISRDQANELQDVLRTLAPSGTALIRSARDLVRRYEALQRGQEPQGDIKAGGEAEQLRAGIEEILGALDHRTQESLIDDLRGLIDRVDARDSLALLSTYDDLKQTIKTLGDNNKTLNLALLGQQKVTGVYAEVAEEQVRQDQKWGEQNHDPFVWFTILGEEYGEACQKALSLRFWKPGPDWTGQAGAATDYRNHLHNRLRTELVQVAAVSIAFIECLDREIWQWGSHDIPEAR